MNGSLKSVLPAMADVLGVTADELYGCQRRLVSRGILHSKPGRGPGSGTSATAEAITSLLVNFISEQPLQRVVDMRRTARDRQS